MVVTFLSLCIEFFLYTDVTRTTTITTAKTITNGSISTESIVRDTGDISTVEFIFFFSLVLSKFLS